MATRAGRLTAISDMFEVVERRWGSIERLTDKFATVERVRELSAEPLRRLMRHESLALVVEGFVSPRCAATLGARLGSVEGEARNWSVSSARGLESSDVESALGTPFNVAVGEARVDEYLEGVRGATARLRRLCGDSDDSLSSSPLDRLRLELDDAWEHGAMVSRELGRARHPGLGRVMRGPTRWEEGFVHVDELAPLSSESGLFSANVYLQQPEVGGDLELWPVGFRDRLEFYKNALTLSALTSQDREAQQRLRAKLPPPVLVRPAPGDLVLLCVQRPHAVTGFASGTRVSLQSFLKHERGQPLFLEN